MVAEGAKGEQAEEGLPEGPLPDFSSCARACRKGATKVADVNNPKGTVHIFQGEIFLELDKPTKKLKLNALLFTLADGTAEAQNRDSEQRVLYDISEKSWV